MDQIKSRLRDTIEQYEASSEELKASNEELQAMNEELRSSAEELETSREELQSVNEELTTVNQELKSKVDDLGRANSDLANLMAATGVATIFVDRTFRITRYTPSAVTLFRLIPSDLGRPLTDLNHRLNYPDLKEDALRVLETLISLKREVSDGERWFLAQLLPYRTADDRIAGVVLTFVDITESRASEQALRESEERMRFATEAAKIYGWELDPETLQIRYANNLEVVLGFPLPTDLQEMFAYVHPEDRGELSEKFETAFERKTPFHAEYRIVHPKTQADVWQCSHGIVVENDGRKRFVGITQNIDDRRRAEEELGISQRRLRLAQEAGSVGIWDWDVESGQSYWSETLWKLFGYPEAQTTDPRAAWKKHLISEDQVRVDLQLRELLASPDTEFRTQFRIRCLDGKMRWLESVARISRAASGRPLRMMGVNFEITDRKASEAALRASEERLRLIVENARDYAIFSMDLNRQITSWNSGAQSILGYTPEEAIGQPGDIIFTEADRAAGGPEAESNKALYEGRASDERWHVRKDGAPFWGSGVMMAMRNVAGEAIGLVKIFQDQTEQLRAKEALEQSRQDLWASLQETERARADAESAGNAKDHFLAVLSHELRTPLTPVMMATRTLSRRKDLPEAVREGLEMIRRNILLESQFVDELLDVTKIARGKMELVLVAMDLHEAITHALEVSKPDFEAKEQHLTVSLEATGHRLDGDFPRLQQVVWNLLKNASKFTPQGGRISVCTHNEPGRILIEVSDSGIGIEPEVSPRIFEAFTQADVSITREYGGLGLGLAIAKASVQGHGGELRVASAGKGQGATFIVSLPLAGKQF